MPTRVQMTRRRPWRGDHPDAVIVARQGITLNGADHNPWANPYRIGEPYAIRGTETWTVRDHAHAVDLYREYLAARPGLIRLARRELAGRDLACWCRLDAPCHGDVLLRVAAGGQP